MGKQPLKKLLALALSILMMTSPFTELIVPAQAAEPTAQAVAYDGVQDQFRDPANGRPNLFVDFLGDNHKYRSDGGPQTVALNTLIAPGGYDQSTLSNPTGPNNIWSLYANSDCGGTNVGTIFWVGIGIDRKEVFQLLKDGGLTSFEGGFYYDERVVEPYYNPAYVPTGSENDPNAIRAAYLRTIREANINNPNYPANTQWNSNYDILRAELDLDPTTDRVTQEEIANPSIDEIFDNTPKGDGTPRDWRMTYVSLELKDINTPESGRRLSGVYQGIPRDGEGNPLTEGPASASGDGLEAGESQIESDYQYLLLIPFRLKAYGGYDTLHLRLLRNATHFSIGAGEYGVDPYGAWERVTTRNPGRDIKLLTRFTGDLYLFGQTAKAEEVEYDALLRIQNGGGSQNTAKLTVDDDPAVWPVWADSDGERIYGLQSGVGMRLDVHAQNGYKVTVTVTYPTIDEHGNTVIVDHDFTKSQTNPQDSVYTFVMPEFKPVGTVTVTVVFEHETGDTFALYLSDIPQPGDPGYKTGNETTITTNLDENYDPTADTNTINSFDAVAPHPNSSHAGITHANGPVGEADRGKNVKIHVDTHADYEAVVKIYRFDENRFTPLLLNLQVHDTHTIDTTPTLPNGDPNPDYGAITLPYGGDITFTMDPTDLDVEVTYRLARRHKATLEVYHGAGVAVDDKNVAQLAYLVYDDGNIPSTAYSGVVYEDDTQSPSDHRAVKDPKRKLDWISQSQAALSGSLGGDTGRVGRTWHPGDLTPALDPVTGGSTAMALLFSAPDLATFQSQLSGLDLSTTVVLKDGGGNATFTGLRKDLYGEVYGDADVSALAAVLWELRQRILADITPGGLRDAYLKEVTRSATDTTVAYTYFDLTAAQVQDYLLTVFQAQDAGNTNQSGYRTAYRAYLTAKQVYDRLVAQGAVYDSLAAPRAPVAPASMKVDSTGTNPSYVRTYQDIDYTTTYLANYNSYIAAYQTYVNAAETQGSPSAPGVPPAPSESGLTAPSVKTAALKDPASAAAAVAAQVWKTADVKSDSASDPAHTIETREGRTVWIALEADSAYEVAGFEFYERLPNGTTGAPIPTTGAGSIPTPTQAAGYQNVYSFTMPDRDCVVRVIYRLRTTRNLNITVTGAAGQSSNLVNIEAYRVADPASTKPQLEKRTNDGHFSTSPYDPGKVEQVFVGSTVTITVRVHRDYDMELRASNHTNATAIQITGPTDNRDGTYTFVIPGNMTGDVDLTVAYTPKDESKNRAEINAITPDGIPADAGNTAFWRDGGLLHVLTDVAKGTALTGEITVAPGYYIRSVTAYGPSGNYTYTLTGNGYNGGYGTSVSGTSVPVNVFVDMPGENLTVDVEFGYGIPPREPENTLTLTVQDKDNEGPAFAENWAKATIYNAPVPITDTTTAPAFTLGEVGKHSLHGNGVLSQRNYATPGQWVKVDFHNQVAYKQDGTTIDPSNSYYVSSVTVGPSNLGVSMVWEDDHTVSFYMPAGSAGVTVEFSKYPDDGRLPTYYLWVQETYTDLNPTPQAPTAADLEDNRATLADSVTIQSWNHAAVTLQAADNPERVPPVGSQGTGAAQAGEEVTMTFTVDEANWYVQSVVVISDGAAYRAHTPQDVTPAGTTGTKRTYQTTFRMPTGDTEFIIHYRRGPKPTTADYAFTLILSDDDNVLSDAGSYDDNHITASFANGAGQNIAGHTDLTVGRTPTADPSHTTEGMTGVRHIHAGDTVTLKTTIAPGYTLDYMIVNPTGLGISPVWTSPDTATFTMPSQGVAVVARIIKGDPQRYTANLILHPPTGISMDGVGQGTFRVNGGTLTNYPTGAIFSTAATPGATIPYDLYAFDGYYIDRVTIDPALGATGSLSGAFGYQDGEFVMPAANVNVNVWFKKGWPDEAQYRLTLEVFDSALKLDGNGQPLAAPGNNSAHFTQVVHTDGGSTTVFIPPDSDRVYGGQRKLLRDAEGVAFDRDTVFVAIDPIAGFYVDSSTIGVTDSAGDPISWWYAPGGIAFTMPPRSTTVRVTFKQGTPPTRRATLHLSGVGAGDSATLSTDNTAATPTSVNTDGGTIVNLFHGDTMTLNAVHGADRHITAAYAVNATTGQLIPLTHDLAAVDLVHAGGTGEFAMPEADVDVYVRFASGAIRDDQPPLKLLVSGVPGSGSAKADVTGSAAQTMTVGAPGMDTRFVSQGDQVTVTFTPDKANGYAIAKLEVYDTDGNPVPYDWISVLQQPPTLSDPSMWLGTAPGASHPTWVPNPDLQITFTMPEGSPAKGVTVHVTYDKVDPNKEYTAQVVVNNEAYSDQPTPTQNNAWLRNQAIDNVQRKLQTAKPGDWIDLDISVHAGYRIEYVKVVPQSFGIVPTLPLTVYDSQNTGFYMPGGDVVVYVKFADDGLSERSATLVVAGAPTGDATNRSVIASPRSGVSSPVYVGGTPQSVVARPVMDWVTTDYYWNTNGSAYIKSVTVTTVSGTAVPFTQNVDPATGHGQITFPMVDENVTVRVEYTTVKPQGEEIYLHVIDATTGAEVPIGAGAQGSLTYTSPVPAVYASWTSGNQTPLRRDAVNPWGNTTGPYYAPAGHQVSVAAQVLAGGVHIESAYVLYEAGGQMIEMNLPAAAAAAGNASENFVVHPGRNDVYITFTRRTPAPNEHAAVLMLKAPEDDAGKASICVGSDYDNALTDTVGVPRRDKLDQANHGHARVVAVQNEHITVQVAPAEGYVIDYVLVTPLGFPLQSQPVYHYTQVGNTISFEMPHCNVAVTVVLKRGTNRFYDATLHYVNDALPPAAPAIQTVNYAQLAWVDGANNNTIRADEDPGTTEANATTTSIREGTMVDFSAFLGNAPTDPAHPDTILSAFVLWNGTLVNLTPALEGVHATTAAVTNPSAQFTMPAGDVDVFLVVTTDPPTDPWHTVVLVATDTSPAVNNSGDNLGYLWKDNDTASRKTAVSTGHPGCAWMAVEEGKTFSVQPQAHAGYAFEPPATLSCNDGAHGGNMTAVSTSPYIYRDTMGTCNKAALINFVSDEALSLTVVIRDPENPSDGSTTNKLLTQTTGVPDLELTSQNVGGAYQVIPGVTPGADIKLEAAPAPGFIPTAQIFYIDGSWDDIPLTLNGSTGKYEGSIPMPQNNATIIVTFHGDYRGTLTLRDLSTADKTAQATMKESTGTAPDRVTVNHLGTSGTLTQLPNGTLLTANMIDLPATKTVTALLNRNGHTTILSPTPNGAGVDEYFHTINRADAEIVMVVRDTTDPTYVAAVRTVNMPAGTTAPTIQATPAGAASGTIWTTARSGDSVQVDFTVPAGYRAVVTSDHANGPSGTYTASGSATFTMPAANVQVTITYEKTRFDLTLRVVQPAGTTNSTVVTPSSVAGGDNPLTQNGHSAVMAGGETVTLTQADPDANAVFRSAFWTATDGTSGFLLPSLNANDHFTMPAADTVVTVVYDGVADPPHYIALVEVDNGGEPGNRATNLANTTTSGLPGDSPVWVEGVTGDAIRVAYQIEPGYVVRVTAKKRSDNGALAVSNVTSPSNGSATVTMPGGTDVVIHIQYIKQEENAEGDVILQLVEHGGEAGNRADVTSPIASTLDTGATPVLNTDGTASNGAHVVSAAGVRYPGAVETEAVGTAKLGDELRVYANWAANYQVARMTIAVRRTDNTETPEVPITVSRYGVAAAGRTLMPYVDKAAGEKVVVRVYYGNIYEATLHIIDHDAGGLDVNGNQTSATDDRSTTVTSTGTAPINVEGDKLIDLTGDGTETVQTTAIPGTGQRLVGVVWESASTGAASASPNGAAPDQYDFTMPADNVDFYAVYEPDDPDNRHYIAKVNFDGAAHLGDSQNAVTITNTTDSTAAAGRYWTAAKAGEVIVVNVKVAPGYKAEITRTYEDDSATHTPPYDFYTSRTAFVPNLTLGKDATFTMPANTDATVTVRYTKGYDLELEVADTSKLASAGSKNTAHVTTGETPARTLHGESDGTTITYTPAPSILSGMNGGENISTNVTAATNGTDTAKYKLYYASPFTGTVRVDDPYATPPATNPYSYAMPSADTVETVVFYNDQTPLLAKVELKGESDIHGNTATPITDRTDTTSPDGGVTPPANLTTTGTVWTTTAGDHIIDLKLTVAKGYIAKIKVRRDNANYYNNLSDPTQWDFLDAKDFDFRQGVWTLDATPADVYGEAPFTATAGVTEVTMGFQERPQPRTFSNDIGGEEHFVFTMPATDADGTSAPTDVTVIVEFVFAGTIPQPFDPDNMKMDKIDLDRGFIYGENRGDFALIDIPTLYQDSNKELFDTDNYDKPTAPATKKPEKNTKFQFFLYDAAKDEYSPLVVGTDILLAPEDEDTLRTAGDPYNYYDYKTTLANSNDILDDATRTEERTFVGSRFKLIPTEPDAMTGKRTAGAEALYKMLNNDGSLEKYTKEGADAWRTRLYVIAEDAIGQKSAYTQVWIRPHFTIEVDVISYAPTHETTASLYKLMSQDELDKASGYADGSNPTQELRDAMNFQHYRWSKDQKPYLSNYAVADDPVVGANKWYQQVTVMSSELLGGYDKTYDPGASTLLKNVVQADADNGDFTYALTLEKTSDLTYTRVKLDLSPYLTGFDLTTSTFPSYYDDATMTYTISDIVYLITGDADGDQVTGWQDYDLVYTYVWRNMPWNNTQREAPDPTDPNYSAKLADWWLSTYNPESAAYRCDLDGDRALTVADVNIVQTRFDYNRTVRDYLWTLKADGTTKVLPFGFGGEKGDYATLFALNAWEEGPVDADPYWDELVDPEATGAPPLPNPYVDEAGFLWTEPEVLEEAPGHYDGFTGRPADPMTGETLEVPEGEEAMDWAVYLPTEDGRVELPGLGEDVWDGEHDDDNGPDGTSADITDEE